jgi:murein DD-endopeptidase MepM/ murein hydrolase activator NlpD
MKVMKFSPNFPVKPLKLNQPWGTFDPKDYAQFGFDRHNGVDAAIAADSLVRAPFNGSVYQNGNQPNGGGIYCGFLSDDTFDFEAFDCVTPEGVTIHFPAMQARVLMDFLHLRSISAQPAHEYKAGDVLAIQDNTGFTTGPHTHIQPRRVSYDGKTITFLDSNDAHGSFDPTSFWNGTYAEDLAILPAETQIVQNAAHIVKVIDTSPTATPAQKVNLLAEIKQLVEYLETL